MTDLTIIANRYSTDKGMYYTGNINDAGILGRSVHHGYTEFYDYYFSKFKNKKPVILEIGIEDGGSINMINDYYKGQCEIYCIDINKDCEKIVKSIGNNIHFINMDQSDEISLMKLCAYCQTNDILFDFIIDDGSHMCKHQMITLKYLYKMLKKEGFYIIEDIHTTYNSVFNDDVNNDSYSPISFFTKNTNYAYYSDYINNKIHSDVQSALLIVNRNISGIDIPAEGLNQFGQSLIIFFN